ncbi:hypothetical protein [Azospirillum sp. sgz302134]
MRKAAPSPLQPRRRRQTGALPPRRCRHDRLDFQRINAAALAVLPALLRRWLPDGQRDGHEYVARNPRRTDRSPGSFKVNLRTGRWADFATGDAGGDPIALAAYLANTTQAEAARELAAMLEVGRG